MEVINKIGTFIAGLGLVAIIAGLFNKVPRALQWMDNWGESWAWIIKLGMVSIGAFCWFISRPRADDFGTR
jgi:hypothetical protein